MKTKKKKIKCKLIFHTDASMLKINHEYLLFDSKSCLKFVYMCEQTKLLHINCFDLFKVEEAKEFAKKKKKTEMMYVHCFELTDINQIRLVSCIFF